MFYSTVHVDLLIRNRKFILCSDTFLGSSQKNRKKLGKLKKLKFDKFYFFSASEKSPPPPPPRKSPSRWPSRTFIGLYTKAYKKSGQAWNDPLYGITSPVGRSALIDLPVNARRCIEHRQTRNIRDRTATLKMMHTLFQSVEDFSTKQMLLCRRNKILA